MQVTAPFQRALPAGFHWLGTVAAYGTAFALIAALAFFGVEETRALLLG